MVKWCLASEVRDVLAVSLHSVSASAVKSEVHFGSEICISAVLNTTPKHARLCELCLPDGTGLAAFIRKVAKILT